MPSQAQRDKLRAASRRKTSRTASMEDYNPDIDYLQEAFESRMANGDDGGSAIQKGKMRKLLLSSQYEYFDARELIPNAHNDYIIQEESVEALADLIVESGNITPVIVRGTSDGYEIVDGERRTRACILNGDRYGEKYYMIPARYFPPGTLSDDDAQFMLNAENVGQRQMTPSERARGIARVSERILARRKESPEMYAGRATKDILAAQFGLSPRTIAMETNIGNNLSNQGMQMFDDGQITKKDADAIARLDSDEQKEVLDAIEDGTIDKANIQEAVITLANPEIAPKPKAKKDTDAHLKSAKRSVARALKSGEKADRALIADIRTQLEILDPDGDDDPDTLLMSALVKIKKATQLDGEPSINLIDEITTLLDRL